MKKILENGSSRSSESYLSANYISRRRWLSYLAQFRCIQPYGGKSVLEIGSGSGLSRALSYHLGCDYLSCDINEKLSPSIVADAKKLPFLSATFDLVCAFQVVEHMPYVESLAAIKEMVRVCRSEVVISVPDGRREITVSYSIPFLRERTLMLKIWNLFFFPKKIDTEHFWEIGINIKKNKFLSDLEEFSEVTNVYHVKENPYHLFIHLQRRS